MIEGLVGIAIEEIVTRSDLAFLQYAELDASQVAAYRDELASFPPLPDMTGKIDVAERFAFLDMTQMLARNGADGLNDIVWQIIDFDKLFATPLAVSVDWNTVLRIGNRWYDRLAAALRKRNRTEMKKALDEFDADLKKASADARRLLQTRRQVVGPEKGTAEAIGNLLVALSVAAVPQARIEEDRAVQMGRNLRVAFALAAYRSDHGGYPGVLDQLVPKYSSEIPDDLFSGEALIYRPSKEGYLLYSVGFNGKDDSGRWYDDEPAGDDPSIQMPPRAVKIATAYAAPSPGPIVSSGIAVTATTELTVRQKVQVKWGDEWWAGEVLRVQPNGRVRIHYLGWDSDWDEDVPRSRLQLPRQPRQ